MGISLPYSKSKRYLSGIDWIVGNFHRMTEQTTGTGNLAQVVLEMDGPLEESALRQHLQNTLRHFPVINGRPARCWNLAPYWRIPKGEGHVGLEVTQLADDTSSSDLWDLLQQRINQPLRDKQEKLEFHLVNVGNRRSSLAMRFDHRLLDARGAESLLNLLQTNYEKPSPSAYAEEISLTEPARLSDWKRNFIAGTHINRTFRSLKEAHTRTLALPATDKKLHYQFDLLSFDEQQSQAILDTAYKEAGYLMLMPYVLAAVVRSMHKAFSASHSDGTDYVIPISIESRGPRQQVAKLFFNHVSFLFFKLPVANVEDPRTLIQTINEQLYEQTKSELPRHFEEASLLMRIVPLSILSRLSLIPLKGHMGSFCFSYVGDTAYSFPRFMDVPVSNLYHMPRVPIPPGTGIFFNRFHGRLNAIFSRLEGLWDPDLAAEVADELENILANQNE